MVTIYSQISLSGIALRTGEQATVHLNWQDRDGGPILIWPGCPEGLSAAQAFTLGRRSERMTELLCPPQNLVMPEHLMAALAFYPHLPLSIDCPQGVLPLLDGSAEPWVHAFAAIAQDHRETHQAPQEYASALRLNWAWEGGFLKAEASDHFAVIYEVGKGGYHSRYSLTAAALAITEVLPARTFIFGDDWLAAQSQGKLKGAMADSGLLLAATLAEAERASNAFSPSFQVFNPDPTLLRGDPALLHPASYRLTHEAARHKILDLLGDLALLELRLPRLRLHLRNAGHYHHHQLLEALTHERFPT